jgi:Raf kinase inhibitor-like YbhB/YbcL family protein
MIPPRANRAAWPADGLALVQFGRKEAMRTMAFGATLAGALAAAGVANAMTVTSPDIRAGAKIANEQVFNGWDCTGGNISPALSWTGAPKDTKSFAVSMYDPDAPTGSGFWHWWVANIPASVTSLPKGAGGGTALPAGAVQPKNDFSLAGYGGPCPPKGKPHHYVITVYALKADKLDVDANASAAVFGFYANANALAKATLIGLYGR